MKASAVIIFTLIFFSLISFVEARADIIDVNRLKYFAVPIHVFELILSLFIAYMALKFFKITKPVNLFFYMYLAIGFFIVDISLYLFSYLSLNTILEMDFISVYIGSRVALMGMLVSFVIFFYQWDRVMRKKSK